MVEQSALRQSGERGYDFIAKLPNLSLNKATQGNKITTSFGGRLGPTNSGLTTESEMGASARASDSSERGPSLSLNLAAQADRPIETAGKYVIPSGVESHTDLEFPFGGTIALDHIRTGPNAAAYGGRHQHCGLCGTIGRRTLSEALEEWHQKAEGRAAIDSRGMRTPERPTLCLAPGSPHSGHHRRLCPGMRAEVVGRQRNLDCKSQWKSKVEFSEESLPKQSEATGTKTSNLMGRREGNMPRKYARD